MLRGKCTIHRFRVGTRESPSCPSDRRPSSPSPLTTVTVLGKYRSFGHRSPLLLGQKKLAVSPWRITLKGFEFFLFRKLKRVFYDSQSSCLPFAVPVIQRLPSRTSNLFSVLNQKIQAPRVHLVISVIKPPMLTLSLPVRFDLSSDHPCQLYPVSFP